MKLIIKQREEGDGRRVPPAAVNAGLVTSTAFATAFATSTRACSA